MAIINRLCSQTGKEIKFFQDGYLIKILAGYKNAVDKHNTSVVFVIDGKSGYGKTTLANQLGITLDENYGLHKIYYTPQEFLDGLKTAKKGDCFLFDEAMLISSRSALSSINKMIVQAMSMIRSKNIYIIFCVNAIFDLDKNLAISRADLLLHVYGDSLIKRGKFGAFFRGSDGNDRLKMLYLLGKKYYEYGKPRANFIGRFSKEFVVDEKEYEKRKQKGVNEFLSGKVGSGTAKAYKTRNNLIRSLFKGGKTVKELSEMTGLSIAQVHKIVHPPETREKDADIS